MLCAVAADEPLIPLAYNPRLASSENMSPSVPHIEVSLNRYELENRSLDHGTHHCVHAGTVSTGGEYGELHPRLASVG